MDRLPEKRRAVRGGNRHESGKRRCVVQLDISFEIPERRFGKLIALYLAVAASCKRDAHTTAARAPHMSRKARCTAAAMVLIFIERYFPDGQAATAARAQVSYQPAAVLFEISLRNLREKLGILKTGWRYFCAWCAS